MSVWQLFPYPTIYKDEQSGRPRIEYGSLIRPPENCLHCPTTECFSDTNAKRSEIRECRYGITYSRIDDDRILAGVVATNMPSATKLARKRSRKHPELRAKADDLRRAIASASTLGPGVIRDFEQSKQEVLSGLKDDPDMFSALARQLRDEFQETLSQSHDFLQLVKLVRGYAEVLLHGKYPDLPTLEAAEKLPTEGAIYFSTELMLLKMDALTYLNEINQVYGAETSFQIHPFVLKYIRIYKWQADQKDLDIRMLGEARGRYYYNSQAIGAVIQGILDNLLKYAPAGSRADVTFKEVPERVTIEFASLGPKITGNEFQQIFLPGFRARAAKAAATSGLGLGLATAKQISDALDLNLTVTQEHHENPKYHERYLTTFSILLDKKLKPSGP